MGAKHTAALVAASEGVPALDGRVFVTRAAKGTVPPYLVWHPAAGINSQDRHTSPRSTRNPEFTGHLVGETAAQVEILLDLLEAELFPGGLGVKLDVTGEKAHPLQYSVPVPIQVQEDPLPGVVYGVIEVSWASMPT